MIVLGVVLMLVLGTVGVSEVEVEVLVVGISWLFSQLASSPPTAMVRMMAAMRAIFMVFPFGCVVRSARAGSWTSLIPFERLTDQPTKVHVEAQKSKVTE